MSTKSKLDGLTFEEWKAKREKERERFYGHLWKLPFAERMKRWDELDKREQRKIAEENSFASLSVMANYLVHIDIPSAIFLGAAIGWIMTGIVLSLGGIWECLFNPTELRSWQCLIGGIACFAVGMGWRYVTQFYWRKVVCKTGVLAPQLAGAGLLLGLIAILSSVFTAIELSFGNLN